MRFWQTIQFKVIFSLCLIFILIISLMTTVNYNFSRNELVKTLERSSFHLNESIKSSLEIAMLSGKRSEIQQHVEKIAADEHILELFIIDKSGEIRVSSRENRIGMRLAIKDKMCQFCHLKNKVVQSSSVIYSQNDGKKVLRTVTSIVNKKDCQLCHRPKDPIVGVLFLDYSLSPYEQEFRNYSRKIALSGIALIISLSLMTIIVLNQFIIHKIKKLIHRIKSIGNADFNGNSLAKSNDEFGLLARSIDKMGGEIQKSFVQLRENKQYFQKIINSIHDGLLVVDRNFQVVLINDLLLKQCKKREEDILGQKCCETLGEFICGYPKEECECPSREVFETGKYCRKKIKLTSNGQERYHEIFASPLFREDDSVIQTVEIVRDVTETERLERELQQSEKMAAIGQLAAGIAHEINNPLATISTCLEGIRDRVDLQKKDIDQKTPWVHDYLQRINQSVYRCKSIIDKLLIFSRPSKNVKQIIDLNKIVEDTISVVSLRAQKEKKKIQMKLSPRPMWVSGDPNQLSQVFINILINGLDAVQEGGNILIETAREKNWGVVKIIDDGIGIDNKDLVHIFEPFFTTKAPNKGTGLGLAISQQIVEEHGGSIRVESKKGEGTLVEIRLPIRNGKK